MERERFGVIITQTIKWDNNTQGIRICESGPESVISCLGEIRQADS